MAEPLLSIDRLSSGYGDFQALFEVSFDLPRGEVLGLVGANGAGKTTLFRAIMGMLPRSKAMVRFNGQPIGGTPSANLASLGIAMVPKRAARLFRSLSVEEKPANQAGKMAGKARGTLPKSTAFSRSLPKNVATRPFRFQAVNSRWWPLAAPWSPTPN